MKKLNKKGFTIVELVIVIAVIGILSAVLIPTFSNLTEKANISAAEQTVANEYKNWLIDNAEKTDLESLKDTILSFEGKYYFKHDGNQFVYDKDITAAPTSGYQSDKEADNPLFGNFFKDNATTTNVVEFEVFVKSN